MHVKHDAILDFILLNPSATQEEVARHFGMGRVWITCILNSDCFRAALKERQSNIAGLLDMTVADRIRGTAVVALERLAATIETSLDGQFLLDATDKLLHRAGYAPSKGPTTAIQVNNNVQNNMLPVGKDVLAECRREMLNQANSPGLLEGPQDEEVVDAILTELKVSAA